MSKNTKQTKINKNNRTSTSPLISRAQVNEQQANIEK